VHHGDGVEEAFLTTNRVMTVSFHQYDEKEKFFPGTGSIKDVGEGDGKYYAINVPLRPGCTDDSYGYLFPIIMDRVMEVYRPDAIWLQCGADSLHGDLIGGFNVTTRGHGAAIQHMLKFGKPIILVGGGGYTIENVSRAWAYETSICLGKQLDNKLPDNLEYQDSYKDDPFLHYTNVKHVYEEQNDKEYLNEIVRRTFDNLKKIDFAPNIQGMEVPTEYKLKDENVWQEGNDSKVLD
jgi:histone deacetylase 1/2